MGSGVQSGKERKLHTTTGFVIHTRALDFSLGATQGLREITRFDACLEPIALAVV